MLRLLLVLSAVLAQDSASEDGELGVIIPDIAKASSYFIRNLGIVFFFSVAILFLLLPIKKLGTFQDIVTAALGSYFSLTHLFAYFIVTFNFLDMYAIKTVLLFICFAMAWLSNMRYTLCVLSSAYTVSYLILLVFEIEYLSTYLILFFLVALCQALIISVVPPLALFVSHVTLASYLILAVFNILTIKIIENTHMKNNSVGSALVQKLILIGLIVGTGVVRYGIILLLRPEEDVVEKEEVKVEEEKPAE